MNIFNSGQDLFHKTIKKLFTNPEYICKPRNMMIREDLGFSARIKNPLDRLVFIPERHWDIVYGLGEFIWYITGSNNLDFISYYAPSYTRFSDNKKTLYGAYGPRLIESYENSCSLHHTESSIRSIIRKLRIDPDSRQAISLIWREPDMHVWNTKDLPCTVALQFFIRKNMLCMITTMRSNDIWLGVTNDIFCFTMIQELIASELGIKIGFYQHNAGSMHLYDNVTEKIRKHEGFFKECHSFPMTKIENFHEQIRYLIRYEKATRESEIEIDQKSFFNKTVNNRLSTQIKDLMLILYYGKIRKLYSENDKNKYSDLYKNIIMKEIKDSAIARCIQSYEKEI